MASAGRLVRPFTPTACAQARQLPPLQSARAHTRIHRSRSSRTHARTLRAASAQACPPHARQHAPAARTHAKPRGSARERPAARRPHSGSISERVHVPRPHGRISLATPPPSPRHFCTAGRLNRPTGRLEPEAPPERHRRGGQSGASSRAAEPTCGSRVEGSEQHASHIRARTLAAARSCAIDTHAHERGLHARQAPRASRHARLSAGDCRCPHIGAARPQESHADPCAIRRTHQRTSPAAHTYVRQSHARKRLTYVRTSAARVRGVRTSAGARIHALQPPYRTCARSWRLDVASARAHTNARHTLAATSTHTRSSYPPPHASIRSTQAAGRNPNLSLLPLSLSPPPLPLSPSLPP